MTNPQLAAQQVIKLLNSRQFKSAYKSAMVAARQFPKTAFFLNIAGLAQIQMGLERDAIEVFRKGLRIEPGNQDIQNNLIQALTSTAQSERAIAMCDKLLPTRQQKSDLLYFKAMAQQNSGDVAGSEMTINLAITETPRVARLYNLRGVARYLQGKEPEATQDYRKALSLNPSSAETLVNLSLMLSRAGRTVEALEAADDALKLVPDYILAMQRRASVLTAQGRIEEATEALQKVLKKKPGDPETLLELSLIHLSVEGDDLIEQIDAALEQTPSASMSYAQLALARAKILLKRRKWEEADHWFKTGNAAWFRNQPYDLQATVSEYNRIIALTPQDMALPVGASGTSPRPIFVIGLPRSGTTLTEQILSSHPQVFGAGELSNAERSLRELFETGQPFDTDAARRFADTYRTALTTMPDETGWFVDKMPSNYRIAGMLAAAFPDAAIIHMRRDPRDVALSMWHTVLSNPNMGFSFDQETMARILNIYRQYMMHWQAHLGERILHVDYEDLVSDPQGQSRTLASFCGLDWVPDMANPERNESAVRTASFLQVRQPIHRQSVAKWKRHADSLGILIRGLDRDLWPELTER